MEEFIYQTLSSDCLVLKDYIKDGLHSKKTLRTINENIDFLNSEMERLYRKLPTDSQPDIYYRVAELAWIYYSLRDYYERNI